jgi:hypothetical protein
LITRPLDEARIDVTVCGYMKAAKAEPSASDA